MASGAMKRQVEPEAVVVARRSAGRAKGLLKEAKARCGDSSIDTIVVPTIERIVAGKLVDGFDVNIVERPPEFGDKGVVRVMRSENGLVRKLRKLRIDDELIRVALRFGDSFAAARLGGLTANYEGVNPNGGKACEPSRWLGAMDELTKACWKLDDDERILLFGFLIYDLGCADLGEYVARSLTSDKEMHVFTGKLLLSKALKKLMVFYEDVDFLRERHREIGF